MDTSLAPSITNLGFRLNFMDCYAYFLSKLTTMTHLVILSIVKKVKFKIK